MLSETTKGSANAINEDSIVPQESGAFREAFLLPIF